MHASEPVNLCVEKTIALVFETFRGVTREGGVSWSESFVLDEYGSKEECAEARLSDQESEWEALANNPDWKPFPGMGGFFFLDPIGFRYYLAPAMVKELGRNYGGIGLSFQLFLDPWLKDHLEGKWSALQPGEIQCVCEFLKCMIAVGDYPADPEYRLPASDSWARAYRSHWVKLDANPIPE